MEHRLVGRHGAALFGIQFTGLSMVLTLAAFFLMQLE
jgi:hypothetical protein